MKGLFLRFYVHENRKHRHVLLHEWLLGEAKKLDVIPQGENPGALHEGAGPVRGAESRSLGRA